MSNLEDKILEISDGKAMLKIVEILLVKSGLKRFLSGLRNGPSTTDIALFNLLDMSGQMDSTVEADFFKAMQPIPARKDTKARALHNKEYGRFYGYPECCIEAFTLYDMPSLLFDTKFFSKPLSFIVERMYHAYAFHVPCDIECEKTRQLAGGYQTYIRENFPKIASCFEAKYLWCREIFLKTPKPVVKHIIVRSP